MEVTHTYTLTDPATGKTLDVAVTAKDGTLEVTPAGHDVHDAAVAGAPVVVDLFRGKLEVLVFGDLTDPEPTHEVDLAGARKKAPAANR